MSKGPTFRQAADDIAAAQDADVLLLNTPISRPLDEQLIAMSRKRRKRKNVVLLLVTEGGDADAAYRIATCLQQHYTEFTVLVGGYCKSAGTLVALGATELVIADLGELGPLDVQISKPDEIMQMQSGLTATSALATLHDQAFSAFEHFFLHTVTRSANSISTRTATHIAVQLTVGLFAPIYSHVDPMHVGEAGRALQIAEKYGQMLQAKSGNFSSETLTQLTSGYPSHGFIIDRKEATDLFKNVREPNALEQVLLDVLGEAATGPLSGSDRRLIAFLSTELPPPQAAAAPNPAAGEGEDNETVTKRNPQDEIDSGQGQQNTARDAEPTGANDVQKAEPAGSVATGHS